MRGRFIHSVEGDISFSPARRLEFPAQIVRFCKLLFVDVLLTLMAALVVGSLTLLACDQLDQARFSDRMQAEIERGEVARQKSDDQPRGLARY